MTEEEKELQKYAEEAALKRFKKEVLILKGYQFKKKQLQEFINVIYHLRKWEV